MRKLYSFTIALFLTLAVNAQTIIYQNTFEGGVGAATIVGSGAIESVATPGFGKVFHNAVGGQLNRTNYLLLSDTIFKALQRSKSFKLTVGVWVNKSTATNYHWTPLFSAYGAAPTGNPLANTWPMAVFQTRFWVQINCAGWCDFTNADNVAGTNFESSTWVADSLWHYYTATLDTTAVKVYLDGVLQDKWNLNGTNGHTIKGMFTNGSELKYICLGGNQAWNWGDPDPAFCFDDITIYADTLTKAQINAVIAAKKATGLKQFKNEGISIFPNPTTDNITVDGISGKAKVVITSINGKLVTSKEIVSGQQINLAGLPKGTYLVKITSKNGTTVKKVVVK